MSAAAAHAADADGPASREKSEGSVFTRANRECDIAASADDQLKPLSEQALAQMVSGPLLMTQTLSAMDAIPDIPFARLCNDGSQITGRNLLGKLARLTLTPVKELYLPFLTWGLPTNFLMVREFGGWCVGV